MAIHIDPQLTPQQLLPKLNRLFELSAAKILGLERSWNPQQGTPVFTVAGRYTSRNWTEWTQGFQFGSALLQFDATGEKRFLEMGRRHTIERMATHVSHVGVHDHGFNNLSTYGNLRRLMRTGRIPFNEPEKDFCELALKVSGAVQAARWTELKQGRGYIYSFNGPHSLFIDTVRSLRSLAVAHQLGHVLMGEHDEHIDLLGRLLIHLETTAAFNVSYGQNQDAYDIRGRVTQECIFNLNDGAFRCRCAQQGYSPYTTWTRGLAWAVCGFAEELEFLDHLARPAPPARPTDTDLPPTSPASAASPSVLDTLVRCACATADFFIDQACTDGIPAWDTGAPGLPRLGEYQSRPADPFNTWEPVDSSAAAIAAQGLIRLGHALAARGQPEAAARYRRAGLTVTRTLLDEPYLSSQPEHQGLLLHSVYHRPNGWDYIAPGQKVPNGESSMWGDYHLRELALLLLREARGEPYLTFFDY